MLGKGTTKRTWSRAERIESPGAIPSRLLAQDPLAAVWGTVYGVKNRTGDHWETVAIIKARP